MRNTFKTYLASSIGKKQIVAVSGLMLIGFVFFHLCGNLLIYWGPDAFNSYTEKLHSMGLVLRLIEFGLLAVFCTHIGFTARLVMENRWARGSQKYLVDKSSESRSFAARTMPFTGGLILLFLLIHLTDFTFVDPYGKASMVRDLNLGLYGLVYNSFLNPIRSLFYIFVMVALAFHLQHAIKSVFQTFGWFQIRYKKELAIFSVVFSSIIGFLFASIPIYIMIHRNFWAFLN